MRYLSTRGIGNEIVSFEKVLLEGLARDGGLFVPHTWPKKYTVSELDDLATLNYAQLAVRLIYPLIGESITLETLEKIAEETFSEFKHPDIAPLIKLESNIWCMELFHGPTLAFKDYALQFLGRLFDQIISSHGKRLTIIGATSGDTGSAAIQACRGREALSIVIFHPQGRISEVQRRQMTTVVDHNVYNVAIDGTFDDCQSLIKSMFNDLAFRDRYSLAAINSINWARILAQTVYYAYATLYLRSIGKRVSFSVPTGNFGNVYSGYVAMKLGFPIEKILVATNSNDIIGRCLSGHGYYKQKVVASISPSMDIQIASNFERILYDILGKDSAKIRVLMTALDIKGGFKLDSKQLGKLSQYFVSTKINDERALECMRQIWSEKNILIDPHSAVGIAAAQDLVGKSNKEKDLQSVICLSTAHPAKFPEAVEKATGVKPKLPEVFSDLMTSKERMVCLPNDLAIVKDYVRACS